MALTKVPSNLDATIATTQSQADNSTNIATTAYVDLAVSNLSDSAPAALNTLNEIAAALGDDANYASTTTAAIAAKLPLAGGTMTGNLTVNAIVDADNYTINGGQGTDGQVLTSTGSGVAWEAIPAGGVDGIVSSANATAITIDSAETIFHKTTSPTLHPAVTGIVFENGSLLNDVTRGDGKSITLAQNLAIDSGNTWTYLAAGEGSYYQQFNGNHYFGTAVSGSAGADATVNTKMFIDSTGNVGIGRTDPTQLLEVHKAAGGDQTVAKFSAHNYEDTGKTFIEIGTEYGDGSSRIGSFNDTANKSVLVFDTHDATSGAFAERMRINSSGNVGIGTVDPDNTLHIHKGSAGTVDGNTNAPLTVENSAANYIQMLAPNGQETGILFGNPANSADSGIIHSDTDNTLTFRVGNNSNKVILTSDGYIVAQSQANVRIVLGSTGNSSNNTSNWIRGNQGYLQFNSASSGYNWEINGANKMTMDANGKVTFVAASIDLNNSGTYTVNSQTTGTVIRGAGVRFLNTIDHRTPTQSSMTHYNMAFGFTSYSLNNTSAWADIIYLNSYGDASGGSPNAIVVSRSGSNAKIVRYPFSTTSTTAISGGTQYGLDSASASDSRLKENVSSINNGLAIINALRPVTFDWNDTYISAGMSKNTEEQGVVSDTDSDIVIPGTKVENVGLIAQEVEAILPTVVHQNTISIAGTDYKTVKYEKLVPHLIAAIQEQQALIESLTARIATLEG